MKATTIWEQREETPLHDDDNSDLHGNADLHVSANSHAHGELEDAAIGHVAPAKVDLNGKATALKRLVHSLLMEVQSLDNIPAVDFKDGIDFYDEVRRYEIALIQQALAQTGGHQLRAARLLNMKVTTLNSKIKHYEIRFDVVVGGIYHPDAGGKTALEQA